MSKFSSKILKSAIASLPDAKLYPVDKITVRVGSFNVGFIKEKNEWILNVKD